MKKTIFFLFGLLLPIFIRIWFDGLLIYQHQNILLPLGFIFSSPLLIVIFTLPILFLGIIMSVYGFKNKHIVYAYTIGMIIGIVLIFTLIPYYNSIKYYL